MPAKKWFPGISKIFGLVQIQRFWGNSTDRPRALARKVLGGVHGRPGSVALEASEAQHLQPVRVRPPGQQFGGGLPRALGTVAPLQPAVV